MNRAEKLVKENTLNQQVIGSIPIRPNNKHKNFRENVPKRSVDKLIVATKGGIRLKLNAAPLEYFEMFLEILFGFAVLLHEIKGIFRSPRPGRTITFYD